MIATNREPNRHEVTEEHRERFLGMLPQIQRQAQVACCRLDVEARQEFLQAVIVAAYAAFFRLVELGKQDLAFPTALARYGVLHVCSGRSVGTRLNIRDITSRYGQSSRRCLIQRLDRRYADGMWKEAVVEDRRAGPAEVAATRIDLDHWFVSLPLWKRRIAKDLAYGHRTGDVARRHAISKSRVSQLRQELRLAWLDFQGELPEVLTRRVRSGSSRRVAPACCVG